MELLQALQNKGYSEKESKEIIIDLKNELDELLLIGEIEEGYYILEQYGLEPDYLMDLI